MTSFPIFFSVFLHDISVKLIRMCCLQRTSVKTVRFWIAHSGGYEDYCHLGSGAVLFEALLAAIIRTFFRFFHPTPIFTYFIFFVFSIFFSQLNPLHEPL